MDNLEFDEELANLVARGVLEPVLGEDGEFFFQAGPNVDEVPAIQDLFPTEEDIQATVDDLEAQGLVEVIGMSSDGEPVYRVTEEGAAVLDNLD